MQSSFYDALNLLSKEGNSKPRINMLTMLAVRTRPFLVPHQHLASRTFNGQASVPPRCLRTIDRAVQIRMPSDGTLRRCADAVFGLAWWRYRVDMGSGSGEGVDFTAAHTLCSSWTVAYPPTSVPCPYKSTRCTWLYHPPIRLAPWTFGYQPQRNVRNLFSCGSIFHLHPPRLLAWLGIPQEQSENLGNPLPIVTAIEKKLAVTPQPTHIHTTSLSRNKESSNALACDRRGCRATRPAFTPQCARSDRVHAHWHAGGMLSATPAISSCTARQNHRSLTSPALLIGLFADLQGQDPHAVPLPGRLDHQEHWAAVQAAL